MTLTRERQNISTPQDEASPPLLNPRRPWLAFALIIAGALALTTYKLGACGICKGNEAVEAIFIQQMVEHGKVLFPAVNGGSPMYKPPLFHWTATALDRLMGVHKVTPFNFRLPAAMYTTAGVALTIGFAYGILSTDGAILAGLTLLAAHQYIREGRMGRVDMTLTFFETLALFALWWWLDSQSRTGERARGGMMLYLTGAALGLAMLSKGPVGALIPGLSMGIFLLSEGRMREALKRVTPGPVLLAILIGASWYVAGYLGAKHALLNRQIGSENFGRFFGALGSSPPWFYLGPLLFSSLPVSILVPFAVGGALFSGRAAPPAGQGDTRPERARHAVKLMAIFWLVTLIFFSIAAYKSRWYLLPLWPAAAVILAWWITRLGAFYGGRRVEGGFAAACVAVALFNLFFIPRQEARECARYGYRATAAAIRRVVGDAQPLYAAGFVDEDFAPLLFYLDRDAPFISTNLAQAPAGYIIVPGDFWQTHKNAAPGFEEVLQSSEGRRKPVLLRHETKG
ncbi:MAG: ArnT family glycosyltransferase [Candidatus Binataceae bacterium]